jgi:hypothetical protein
MKTQWRLGTGQVSLLNSATLAASAVGAIIFGRVAGILGCKKIYGYEVLILAIVGSCRDRSIPSIESTREQSPGDDLFHEPEAQPEFVTAEAPIPRPRYVATSPMGGTTAIDTSRKRCMDSTKVSRVGSLRTFSGSLIDESALGSQYRDASLETLGQQGIRLYREKKSASPNQHDNDHDDQDKYKCASSNEHDSFLSLGGLSGVGVPPWV